MFRRTGRQPGLTETTMQRPTGRAQRNSTEPKAQPESGGEDTRLTMALRAGDRAPDIRLSDVSGKMTSLIFALESGPVVVSFLSGRSGTLSGQLNAISEHLADIEAAEGTVLAISPVEPNGSERYMFKILHDVGSSVATAYGLCAPPIEHAPAQISPAVDPRTYGPIPATFVVDQRSRIILSLTEVSFDNNLVPTNVVSALNALRRRKGKTQ